MSMDGANYAPTTATKAVVQPGEFKFAAAFLDHGHIYGQTNGLLNAGGTLCAVYDPNPERVATYIKAYPQAQVATSFEALLEDPSLSLIASAAVPSQRCAIGLQVMDANKDYFTDKAPFTTLDQLQAARAGVQRSGRRYFVYYAERVHNEAAWHAGELIADRAIGDVVHVAILAPHRLSPATRPDWFFQKAHYGGIITDIGSHQAEQFLSYTGNANATVTFATASNYAHPQYPELEDVGEFGLKGETGAGFYSRVDWFTPDGLSVWGDGRTFIVGTQGTLELRKYTNLGKTSSASLILLTDAITTTEIDCQNQVGYPFFGQLILDSLNGTETAMSQAHIFTAAELTLRAQAIADKT